MQIDFNDREIQMVIEAINTQICELYDTIDLYTEDNKVHLMLWESIKGYERLRDKVQRKGD